MPEFDARAFRQVLGSFPSGVTVVATRTETGLHAMTASSFTSVSMDPPLVLVCVAHKAHFHAHLELGRPFSVSILGAEQASLSNHFAGFGTPDVPVVWNEAFGATPVLEGAVGWLDCVTHALHDGGDHTILVGRVERLHGTGAGPLAYLSGKYPTLVPPAA